MATKVEDAKEGLFITVKHLKLSLTKRQTQATATCWYGVLHLLTQYHFLTQTKVMLGAAERICCYFLDYSSKVTSQMSLHVYLLSLFWLLSFLIFLFTKLSISGGFTFQ